MTRGVGQRRTWRVVLSLLLGTGTTVFFACVVPAAYRCWWPPGPTLWSSFGNGTASFGLPIVLRGPFIDLYEITPDSYDVRARAPGYTGPEIPDAVVTTAERGAYSSICTSLMGWPFRAMAAEVWEPRVALSAFGGGFQLPAPERRWCLPITRRDREDVLLPLRPVWGGFAANTAIFAGVWWCVLGVPVVTRAWWREGRRLRRGRCPECGYDLRWDMKAGCGECGWRKGHAIG